MRRKVITHPQLQMDIVISFLAGFFISLLLIVGFLFLPVIYANAQNWITPDQLDAVRYQLPEILATLAWCVIGASLILGAVGFYYSHKVAGPLTRVEEWLERRVLGDPVEKLGARPGDFLKAVIEEITRL